MEMNPQASMVRRVITRRDRLVKVFSLTSTVPLIRGLPTKESARQLSPTLVERFKRNYSVTVNRGVRNVVDGIRTEAVARVLDTYVQLDLLGYGWVPKDEDIDRLLVLDLHGELESIAKQFCAWPMARLLDNPLPKKKSSLCDYEYFVGGVLRRLVTARCVPANRRRIRSLTLAQTLLHSKRAFDPVPETFIVKEMQAHFETLTTVRTESDDSDTDAKKAIVERAIRLIVADVFPKKSYRTQRYIPSFNSSWERTRGAGGACAEILGDDELRWNRLANKMVKLASEYSHLGNPAWAPPPANQHLLHMEDDAVNGVLAVYGYPIELPQLDLSSGRVQALVCAVLEPCKLRTVTAGESFKYWLAKTWNKNVYRYLPRHPVFRLTGRPVRPGEGPDAYGDFSAMTWRYLLSGDYKGATDSIYRDWSEYALDMVNVRMGVPFEQRPLLRDCLTRHDLSYPIIPIEEAHEMQSSKLRCDPPQAQLGDLVYEPNRRAMFTDGQLRGEQEDGQLMGSPVSFPILCILNAAVNWAYLDPELKGRFRQQPLLINGDDVMSSSDRDYADWPQWVSVVGFELSVGKNYVHQDVFCINSEFYLRHERRQWGFFGMIPAFTRLPYLHLGLLMNSAVRAEKSDPMRMLRGEESEGFTRQWSCGQSCHYVVEMSRGVADPDAVISRYVQWNWDVLTKTKRNWYLPRCLGGVGLPLTRRTAEMVTTPVRKLAAYVLTRPTALAASWCKPRSTSEGKLCTAVHGDWCRQLATHRRWKVQWSIEKGLDPMELLSMKDYLGQYVDRDEEGHDDDYERVLRKATQTSLTPVSTERLLALQDLPLKAAWVERLSVSEPYGRPVTRSVREYA